MKPKSKVNGRSMSVSVAGASQDLMIEQDCDDYYDDKYLNQLSMISSSRVSSMSSMSSARMRDRRQSTPVMVLAESLNKLALSKHISVTLKARVRHVLCIFCYFY